jgi:endonuclease YncB( thermonuclease family)
LTRSALGIALAITLTWRALACSLAEGPVRSVVQVIDGDTVVLDDRTELRLVGALKPDPPFGTVAAENWPPAEAAKRELINLLAGQSVLVSFDARMSDRYGRLLAQAYMVSGSDLLWVQGKMIETGNARAYSFPDNRACAAELTALEDAAREKRIGLWSNAAYAIRRADQVDELVRYVGSYQIVEGRVYQASLNKGRIFLDFGPDWHKAFSFHLEAQDKKLFQGSSIDLLSLGGHQIRVRAWLESNGTDKPTIYVTHPEQIQLLDVERPSAPPQATATDGPAGN